jgi:Helicase associated domain
LCQFQNENGHCTVPQKYPVLGQWVHTQRNNYRALVHGKKSALTQERIQQLKSIGFDFGRERQTIARKATEALVEGEEVNEEYDDYDDYSNGADEAEEDNSHDLLLHGSLPVPLNQQFYHLHQVLAPHRQNSEV